MSLTRNWDVADAVELSPRICTRVICPYVVEPSDAISATEPVDN